MGDLKLDTDGDLELAGGDLQVTDGLDSIAQAIRCRLRTFFGEWFLDESVGVPYLQQIFGKVVDPEGIDAIFKREILSAVPNVRLEIIEYTLDLDATTRRLTLRFTVQCTDGIVSFEEVLGG